MTKHRYRAGDRVVMNKPPWPERHGAHGVVVENPNGPGIYPADKPRPTEVIVLLDADPLVHPDRRGRTWTCVVDAVSLIPESAFRALSSDSP